MKTFLVENTRKGQTIKVILHNPPFENENILYKTGWKEKDVTIKEVHSGYDEDLVEPSFVDRELNDEDEG
tara:strand:+ start:348 stop:557 length:210 start_codon:yes stop_codon:yes gene_type:complete